MDLLHNETQGNYKPMRMDSPNGDNARSKRSVFNIYIVKEQIIYDIKAQLLMLTRARRMPTNRQDNNISSIEGFEPMFNRWMEKYAAMVDSRLQAYIMKEFSAAATDFIKEQEEIHFHLAMPDSWDETVFTQLKQAIHDYLVSGVMYEYLSLTLTTKDPVTLSQREQNELLYQDIKRLACAMKTRVRKALHPFP